MQLHSAREKFRDAGFNVVLVGLGTPELAQRFKNEFSLSFPIISDPDKVLYRLYDLRRGSVADVASPSVLIKGLRVMSRGYSPGIPRGDVMQLPGVFLIDKKGMIKYSYYSKDPSDHPTVEALLALNRIIKI